MLSHTPCVCARKQETHRVCVCLSKTVDRIWWFAHFIKIVDFDKFKFNSIRHFYDINCKNCIALSAYTIEQSFIIPKKKKKSPMKIYYISNRIKSTYELKVIYIRFLYSLPPATIDCIWWWKINRNWLLKQILSPFAPLSVLIVSMRLTSNHIFVHL